MRRGCLANDACGPTNSTMSTLDELHWSHYCEKVRLALNYRGLAWRAVEIDAFRKDQLRTQPLPCAGAAPVF